MPWRGLDWRLGFQVNFTKLLHGCCLSTGLSHSACPLSWDEMEVPNASIEKDIDREAIDYFLKNAVEEERLPADSLKDDTFTVLKNLHLVSESGNLRIAAIILFGSHPKDFVHSIDFRIGRFISDESDLLFQDIIQGDII